jgi:nitroreductase
MNTIIQQLNWRYATKQYDKTKKVSSEDLATLKEAVRLAPSAFGLQPYKVLVVETAELREKLRERSWGQPQVTDASHLFVFAAQDTVEHAHIDDYIQRIADARGVPSEALEGFAGVSRTRNAPDGRSRHVYRRVADGRFRSCGVQGSAGHGRPHAGRDRGGRLQV